MKKLSVIIALLSTPLILWSQGVDEAYLFAKEGSFGTARSIGMGSSFGALGGDMSAINVNPAGVAVYRASEFTFSPTLQYGSTSSKYLNSSADDNRAKFSLNQLGFVGVGQSMREATTGIINTNFGFSLQKTNDFNQNIQIIGHNTENSLTDQFRYEADGTSINNLNFLRGSLAYDTYLIDSLPGSYNSPRYLSAVEYIDGANSILRDMPEGLNQWKQIQTSGNNYEMAGSMGTNISNTLYLGASINIDFLNYKKNTSYTETDPRGNNAYMNNFKYNTELTNNGLGLNLKFGAIYRPINAIRLGVSFHTPTWYSMSETMTASLDSYFLNGVKDIYNTPLYADNGEIITGSSLSNKTSFDYSYRTPLKLCGSAAFIIGDKIAISIDYKFIDYSFSKYHASVETEEGLQTMIRLNNNIENTYKATNNINAGIEVKPISSIALRGGFIYNQSGIKNDKNDTYTYTCGIGYRNKNYFLDFAYRLQQYKTIHYIYQANQNTVAEGYAESATINNNTSLFAVTLGVKF